MSISSSPWPSTHRLRTHCHLIACLMRRAYYRALRRSTSATSSSVTAGARIVASPLSVTVKGTATSRVVTLREILNLLHRHERRPRHVLCDPLALQGALGCVWCLHHISGWWSGCTNSSLTYWRSMTGWSTPLSFCRSTPPPSLLQEEMSLSWPTISRLP
jgi:hypothetical protein